MKDILKREFSIASSLSMIAGLTILLAVASDAADWQFEILREGGPAEFNSLKIDKDGNAHVAYVVVDGDRNQLKYGFWDHSLKRWFTMTVDEHASFCSLALDSKQRPHISYADAGSGKGAKLRYAYWDGAVWKKQALPLSADVISYYTSIALDTKDNPHISFYEYEGAGGVGFSLRLRTASWSGAYWEARTVDGQRGSGKFNSMSRDSAGHPQIAYANVQAETSGLRYAGWNGESWDRELLVGEPGRPEPVHSVSIIVDQQDNPHIAYTDVLNLKLKYATRREKKWQFQEVDSLAQEAFPDRHGITVDEQGNPYISYYDAGLGILKVAHQKDQKWVTSVVDRDRAGMTSSVQVEHGNIWIAYADELQGGLKIARSSLIEATQLSRKSAAVPASR